jgi:predicted SAM-dependent methyltransferase
MHDTAYQIANKFFQLYWSPNFETIVELGSYDVNGSLRPLQPIGCKYVGLDIESGPSVDVVIKDPSKLPLPDGYCDCVVASSVLEHDRFFWESFLELCRITKPGGFIYINCPSNGDVHRYPADYWRFYPDAGRGLVDWAKKKSVDITLVESFIADRVGDQWNDFVAVFQLGEASHRDDQNLLCNHFRCTNVHRFDRSDISHVETSTQDRRLLDAARSELFLANEARLKCIDPVISNFTEIDHKLDEIKHLQHFLGAALDREFPVVRSLLDKLNLETPPSTLDLALQEVIQGITESNKIHTDTRDIAQHHFNLLAQRSDLSIDENNQLKHALAELVPKLASAEKELAVTTAQLLQTNTTVLISQERCDELEKSCVHTQIENGKLLGQITALSLQVHTQAEQIEQLKKAEQLLASATTELEILRQQEEYRRSSLFNRIFIERGSR